MMIAEETSEVISATRIALLLDHVKRNNIAYLLGAFMMHTAGATTAAVEYGTGLC
jgi:hypothetical protein